MTRYIIVSSDLVVDVEEGSSSNFYDATTVGALRIDACYFCSDCGAIVYRTDLHNAWHERITTTLKTVEYEATLQADI